MALFSTTRDRLKRTSAFSTIQSSDTKRFSLNEPQVKLSIATLNVPLKEIDVSVNINGFVADVQSTSLYANEEESPIKAIFVFPVDDQSAVYKFETDIDGRHLIAECHDKEQARQIYDDAISYGRTAMLLEETESAGDILRFTLGNLPSKAQAKISMGFVTELDLESDRKLKFTLPTILNPRYSPDAGRLKSTEGASYELPDAIHYKLRFQMIVRGSHKITGVHGPNDQLHVEYLENQTVAKISLAEEFKFGHDLTVLVEYESCNAPQIMLEKGDPQSGGLLKEDVLMVSVLLEQQVDIPKMSPGEFIFIIDRSGSMRGDKIQNARETLLLFLKSLPMDCYFNVIGFGSNFESLFSGGSQKYNGENLSKAEELQTQMGATLGSTEMLRPLQYIYSQTLIDNYPRQLFVLTDGEVSNVSAILKLVRDNSQHSRLFAVGIGHGASTSLVRGIAKAGRGKEVFVTDSNRLQPKVISLLQCAMQPVATDVEIVWNVPSSVTVAMLPPKVPYIFLGVRQILYLLLSGTDAVDPSYVCSITMKGTLISTPFEYEQTFNLHAETEAVISAPIHRLAAKVYIKDLQQNEAPKEQIILASKSANVISKHTAFVMVDNEGQRVQQVVMKRVVPSPWMPSWSAGGIQANDMFPTKGVSVNRPYCCSSASGITEESPTSLEDPEVTLGLPPLSRRMTIVTAGREEGLPTESERGRIRSKDHPYTSIKETCSLQGLREEASDCNVSKGIQAAESYAECIEWAESYDECIESAESYDECIESAESYDECESQSMFSRRMMMTKINDKEKTGGVRMMDIIRLQTFQGSWNLDKTLLLLLGVEAESLKQNIPIQDDSVVATLAVIAWLRKHHSERREEWQMLETKALAWLLRQNLHGHTVEELISKAEISLV